MGLITTEGVSAVEGPDGRQFPKVAQEAIVNSSTRGCSNASARLTPALP